MVIEDKHIVEKAVTICVIVPVIVGGNRCFHCASLRPAPIFVHRAVVVDSVAIAVAVAVGGVVVIAVVDALLLIVSLMLLLAVAPLLLLLLYFRSLSVSDHDHYAWRWDRVHPKGSLWLVGALVWWFEMTFPLNSIPITRYLSSLYVIICWSVSRQYVQWLASFNVDHP